MPEQVALLRKLTETVLTRVRLYTFVVEYASQQVRTLGKKNLALSTVGSSTLTQRLFFDRYCRVATSYYFQKKVERKTKN